jgi:hypothetical protein
MTSLVQRLFKLDHFLSDISSFGYISLDSHGVRLWRKV